MPASDLTNLASVKAWLGLTTTANDPQISALVTSVSRAIYSALQRPNILPTAYSEVLNGNDSDQLALRNWPVISVSSVVMGLTAIQASTAYGAYGWALEDVDPSPPSRPSLLYFRRGRFWRAPQNVAISYVAGYQVAETQTVAGAALTAQQPYGAWASDRGVVYASTGVALSAVAASPAQGQYAVNASTGGYVFNTADNGQSVTLSYGFIPADLAQAAIEWAAFRFSAQSRIGVRSKSIGGQETVSFDTGSMPDFVKATIQPYKRVSI
jgi:hypothetical protein